MGGPLTRDTEDLGWIANRLAEADCTAYDSLPQGEELGLAEVYSVQLVAQSRRIAHLGGQELERRLVEDPESIPTNDLAVVAGIALDKVAKAEAWGSRLHNPSATAAQFMDRLAQARGEAYDHRGARADD